MWKYRCVNRYVYTPHAFPQNMYFSFAVFKGIFLTNKCLIPFPLHQCCLVFEYFLMMSDVS